MSHTVDFLEESRANSFEPLDVFRALLSSILDLNGQYTELLDCGCGTGFFTRQYAQIPGVKATGIDIDAKLLSAARKIALDNNLSIKYELADICKLPYQDNSFDVVASDIMLEVFDDKSGPIQEMIRVCKPNGRVLIIEPNYQSYVFFDPRKSETENMQIIWEENQLHGFGAGVKIPNEMMRAGLTEIKLVPWFWGKLHNIGGTLVLRGIDVYIVCGKKSTGTR